MHTSGHPVLGAATGVAEVGLAASRAGVQFGPFADHDAPGLAGL